MKKLAILFTAAIILLNAAPAMSQQIVDNFYVTVGSGIVVDGGGTGFNGGEWYVYPSNWINQWFYDHPFDETRGKIIHVEFEWSAMDPTCTTDITVAINWSTPEWSALGYGEAEPPLPGVDEEMYIERRTILDVCEIVTDIRHVVFDYIIWAYNPEWVSIDVMGCNFIIENGMLVHECAVGTEDTSWGAIKAIYK